MREDKLQQYREREPDALFDVTVEPPTALLLEVSAEDPSPNPEPRALTPNPNPEL